MAASTYTMLAGAAAAAVIALGSASPASAAPSTGNGQTPSNPVQTPSITHHVFEEFYNSTSNVLSHASVDIGDKFDVQMLMNRLSHLASLVGSAIQSEHSAIKTHATNVRG